MSLTQYIHCDRDRKPLSERGARARVVLTVAGMSLAFKIHIDLVNHGQTDLCDECIDEAVRALGRHLVGGEQLCIPADWQPTPAAIAALPQPLRAYVASLEAILADKERRA